MSEGAGAPVAGFVRQHLVDPEDCIACRSCAVVCPQSAIVERSRVVAIDPSRCDECGTCLDECPTGAIENWRIVPEGEPHSLDEQFDWDRLPPG